MYPDQFIHELGRALNLPNLAFNEDRVCRLMLDDDFAVDVEWIEVPPAIYIYAVVHQRASELHDRLDDLLSANLFGRGTGDGTLALDPNRNEVLLTRRIECDRLDVEWLVGQLDRFAQHALNWTARLAQKPAIDSGRADTASAGRVADGFLKV